MSDRRIRIEIAAQTLTLFEDARPVAHYLISTGLNGVGEQYGSGCTPRGLHRVRLRIGDGCPIGTVFRARRPTGEVYGPDLEAACPGRDWILTRILWLTGCEPGRNRGGGVDTLRRFIYIHGCPDTAPMGEPRSHGCIRMRNADLVELFDLTPIGTPVEILACPAPVPAVLKHRTRSRLAPNAERGRQAHHRRGLEDGSIRLADRHARGAETGARTLGNCVRNPTTEASASG